jgi:hypothetical protein
MVKRTRSRHNKKKKLYGGSGYTPLNPVNYEFTAANYNAGMSAGQAPGHGTTGISSGVDATSGHASTATMKGGAGVGATAAHVGSYALGGPDSAVITGPYAGHGLVTPNAAGGVTSSLNTFPKQFSGGGGGRKHTHRHKVKGSHRYIQRGCSKKNCGRGLTRRHRRSKKMRGGNANYADAYGTKFTFNPTGVNAAEGTIGMANPMPFSAYPGCGAKGL